MKKTISTVLCLVTVLTCLFCFTLSANAANEQPKDYLKVTASECINDEITLKVSLKAGKSLWGAVVIFEYNKDELTPISGGSYIPSKFNAYTNAGAVADKNNQYSASFVCYKNAVDAGSADMDILYVKFKAVSGSRLKSTVKCYCNQMLVSKSNLVGDDSTLLDVATLSVTTLSRTKLVSAEPAINGIKVTWQKTTGATKYTVYRKDGNSWTALTREATGTSYVDTAAKTPGTLYTYTVRSANSSGTDAGFDSAGVSAKYVAPVTTVAVGNTTGALNVKWNAVTAAEKYRVYRRTIKDDGTVIVNWASLADVKAGTTNYVDKSGLVKGTRYQYCVRPIIGSYFAAFDKMDSAKFLCNIPAPSQVFVGNVGTHEGLKVSWTAVAGVDKYRIYKRQIKDDKTLVTNWASVTDVAAGTTSYTEKGLTSDYRYEYCIRCLVGSNLSPLSPTDSAKYNSGVPTPTSVAVGNTAGALKVTWSHPGTNVEKFRVYRRTIKDDGTVITNWGTVADVASSVRTYVDKSALQKGVRYQYCVRAIKGSLMSGLKTDSAKFLANLPAPAKIAVGNSSGGLRITWSAVSGVDKFRVYRRTIKDDGTVIQDWKSVTDVSASTTSYLDKTGLSKGVRYQYCVRSIVGSNFSPLSPTDSAKKQ